MRNLFLLVMLFYTGNLFSQMKDDRLLEKLFTQNQDSVFREVIAHPETYRYQVIYTQINRDKHNIPSFHNYYFKVDPKKYFYPASVVKMPLAFLSLEKLNHIGVSGVNKFTSLLIDSAYDFQTPALTDPTAQTGLPSIAQYIRKAFLVSDNDAYNRMYQFVTQQTINRSLHAKGYPNINITRQFMRLTPAQNRCTNPFRLVDTNGRVLYSEPAVCNTDSFDFSTPFLMGRAYLNWQDSLVNTPMDFTSHNYIPLADLQQILQSVMFPGSVPASRRFDLKKEDYDFLYQYLSQFPGETNFPKYNAAEYYDTYVKYFFNGNTHKEMPEGVRVFNKVGWSYGCLTDISYVVDFTHHIEYMLAATVYVNEDQVLNDDKYEYEKTGLPFLYQLGQTIYRYERERKRKYMPDLSRFKMTYETRSRDERPVLSGVAN